jgi:RNA polymerase sigma-70 factor (ECF subfamily)
MVTDAPTQDQSWSAAMATAQTGDGRAYGALLREITPFVRTLVRRRLNAPDQIEDVCQDVLLCVHRVRHTYDPARPFTPWLAAIVHRRTLDALRRKIRRSGRETSDDTAYETFADPAANKQAEGVGDTEALHAMLATLTPAQRAALTYTKLHEMSLTEASHHSGQSISTLKVNVHRALKALRKNWTEKDSV